ncbi:MAG: Hsp70 family protein [Aminivibrio sp.]|nr:Hsp70 family protein [Synergistaceae bacterium]
MKGPVLGIDLGTKNALCALTDGSGAPVVIPGRWGKRTTPSVAAWTESGWVAGEAALAGEMKRPHSTWRDLKRKLGTNWRGRCGRASVNAEEAIAPLLALLREDGEAYAGVFLESCVLAVPASFSFAERSAMARAARSAGFVRIRMVNEPTAAALAYGERGRVLILDYGAGTVDLSVVESGEGVCQVLESGGLPSCGGWDFDAILAMHLADRAGMEKTGRDSPRFRMLLSEAEEIKIALSNCMSYEWIPPPGLGARPFCVSRRELEALIRPSIEKVVSLAETFVKKHRPSRLLLVGGGSRIPLLRRALEERIAPPGRMCLSPDEAVAAGTALYGNPGGRSRLLLDVLSEDLGILAADGAPVPLLTKGMPLPARVEKEFVSVGRGAFSLKVFQGEGGRVIAEAGVSSARKGEAVTLAFAVDGGGLLRIDIRRENGERAVIPPLEIGTADGWSFDGKSDEIRALEKRFSLLSPLLTPGQQARADVLFRTVKSLLDEGVGPEGLESLGAMVAEMERAVG